VLDDSAVLLQGLEIELPGLAYEVLAEAVMGFFADDGVAFTLVDLACGVEDAVGPKDNAAVARVARECGALVDESAAKAETACRGFDQEEAEASGF